MMGEVCLFDKFSFCKNGERCSRVHLKETCLVRECDYRKCDKRHPWPCRSLMLNRFCRFGSRCRFSHRLPYSVEKQNDKIKIVEEKLENQCKRINQLESKNESLEKIIEEQDKTIKNLQQRVISQGQKEINKLKMDIEKLEKENKEKALNLKSVVKDVKDLKSAKNEIRTERVVKERKVFPMYFKKALKIAKSMEDQIEDVILSKRSDFIMDLESTGIIKVYSEKIEQLYLENEWPGDYVDAVKELIKFANASKGSNVKKEICLSEITKFIERCET